MSYLEKSIYWVMLVICLIGIITNLLIENYSYALSSFSTLCWVGIAWMNQLKYDKLKEKIQKLDGRN
jgi:hypothetical protein